MKLHIERYIEGLKEAKKILIYVVVLLIVGNILLLFISTTLVIIFDILIMLFLIFTINFYRKPFFRKTYDKNTIYSPAEGVVLSIKKIKETSYVKAECNRIFIFMNVFNVHRNTIPMDGVVEKIIHIKGNFAAAFKEVEESNERSIVGLKTKNSKVLFKQVAGLIARRIINNLKVKEKVKAGEEFGYITFGSAVIIYVPVKYKLLVKEKDKVYAGYSKLAILKK